MSDPTHRLARLCLAWLWVAGTAWGADRATELLRREADAAGAARRQMIQKLEAMPAPPPLPPGGDRLEVAQRMLVQRLGPVVQIHQELVRREERDAEDEPRYVVDERTFDLVLYGTTTDEDDTVRNYFAALLERRIVEAVRRHRLSAPQRRRLVLAGRGDIKRLFDRVEDARKTFHSLRSDIERCGDFLAGLLPLSRELRRGPFGPDCLLEKTLRTMLAQAAATANLTR